MEIKKDKLNLIIADDHTFGYINPSQPDRFYIINDKISKGARWGMFANEIMLSWVENIRLATLEDIKAFQSMPCGFTTDPLYHYDRG